MKKNLIDIVCESSIDENEPNNLVPAGIEFTRWRVMVSGRNCLTIYRHDIHVKAPPGGPDPTVHLRTWWLHILGEWGIGLHIPVKVAQSLGLSEK